MAKQALVINDFGAGLAPDEKLGLPHSFGYSKHLEWRKNPSKLTFLPAATKESSTAVDQLITAMVRLPSGKIVGIGATGGIYTRTTAGVWSKNGSTVTDTAFGAIYNKQHDRIYIPGQRTMHAIENADGRFSGGTFTPTSDVFLQNLDLSHTTGGNTYTTPAAISEAAADLLSFTPTVDPLYSIKLQVGTKGTGDVTLTLHDAENNILGTVTAPTSGMTNGDYYEFVFSTPRRVLAAPNGATYHIHVTYDNSGGKTATTFKTDTASDFSTANYETYAARLALPINGFHPVINFLQYICIGNERYLTVWEPISESAPANTEWVRHRLVFPPDLEVCGLATWNQYLAIACGRRASAGTNTFTDGVIFFWDGISTTYNSYIVVSEGEPTGLFSHKNTLFWVGNGGLWAWNGGTPVLVFEFPNTDFDYAAGEFYAVAYPNSMASWKRLLAIGFPAETNSELPEHGVYTYGQRNRLFPQSFGFEHTVSSGMLNYDGSHALRIGCVYGFSDKLLIAWEDLSQAGGAQYGVDIVDANSAPYSTAEWQDIIRDMGRPDKRKQATKMIVNFKALPTGATVTPKYKIDRATSFTTGTAVAVGDTSVELPINKSFNEIQLGFDATAGATTPQIVSVVLIWDDLKREAD